MGLCTALVAVLVTLAWAAPGLQDEPALLLVGCVAAVPGMVGSAFLFWQEIRSNRRELRQARRESRDVPFEEGAEWTSKAIYYGIASSCSSPSPGTLCQPSFCPRPKPGPTEDPGTRPYSPECVEGKFPEVRL